jgi:hypothetical protein
MPEEIDALRRRGMKITRNQRSLARAIDKELLTYYSHEGTRECTRSQLMLRRPDGSEMNMGGLCKKAMVTRIAAILNGHATP